MSRILGIDHMQLAITPGAEAVARQFYGGVLGLPELPKPLEMAGRGGLWFEIGPQQLHLGVEADFHPSKKVHPALLVEDLDWYLARLTAAACPIDTELQLPGIKRAFTRDPFGNRIELMQKL
jgi:catechol 2,3-dioxygenase-like lactoylglutathione lyase family enzyme